MYVCIDILLFQFVLLCFDFFFMKMRADEKYIKSHVSLPIFIKRIRISCMYVYIDISLFQFVLLCFDFVFFMKMRADEKYIKSQVSLPDITLPYLLTVYEFHNFIPFCYLNTEQMKNVDPLFSKNQYGTKSWRGTYVLYGAQLCVHKFGAFARRQLHL